MQTADTGSASSGEMRWPEPSRQYIKTLVPLDRFVFTDAMESELGEGQGYFLSPTYQVRAHLYLCLSPWEPGASRTFTD